MNESIQEYIEKYSIEIQALFSEVRELIIKSAPKKVEEKLWAKLPSFYVGNLYVRVIPFKNHINIEAAPIFQHKSQLEHNKITPKGMLQITINQEVPYDILQVIFSDTLTNNSRTSNPS